MDCIDINTYGESEVEDVSQDDISDVTESSQLEANELSNTDIDMIIEAIEGGRSLGDDLSNPDLFNEHEAGAYEYGESILGKSAFGTLELPDEVQRNPVAQMAAGGIDRKPDDDGGHLIGARFGGSPDSENLDAQNRQLNRGEYKAMENELAEHVEDGDKVFLNVDALRLDESERPDSFMGYAIFEHPDGSRDSKSFSFSTESKDAQDKWGNTTFGRPDEAAALADMEYSDGLK